MAVYPLPASHKKRKGFVMFSFSKCRAFLVAAVLAGTTILGASKSSAESPDGWVATGRETKVFQAQRDDGRWVNIFAQSAKKGSDTGMLVRVSLQGFSDKRLALRQGDLPELFHDYGQYDDKGWFSDMWKKLKDALRKAFKKIVSELEKLVKRELKKAALSVFKAAGDVEEKASTGIADLLQTEGAVAIETRADAVIAAARSGGDLTQRFVAANDRTVRSVSNASRGAVVRAIHSALMSSGAK